MNEEEEKELIRSSRKTIVNYILIGIMGGLVMAVVLAITIPNAVSQNTKKIEDVELKLKDFTTVPVLNQNKIENIEKELAEFKKRYNDDQKDRKKDIDEIRKQNLKIIELLYQVKQQNSGN